MGTERVVSEINKPHQKSKDLRAERRYTTILKPIPTVTATTTTTTRRRSLPFSRNLKQSDVDIVLRPSTSSCLDHLWRKKMSCLKSKTVVTDDESDSPAPSSRRNSGTDDAGRPRSRRGSALLHHVFSPSHSSPPPRQQFFPIRSKDKAAASHKGKAQSRPQSLPAASQRQNKRSASVPDIHHTSIVGGRMTPGGQVAAGFVPMLEHLKSIDGRSVNKKRPKSKLKSKSTTTVTVAAPTVTLENYPEKVPALRHSWNSSGAISEGSSLQTMSIKERRRRSKLKDEGSSMTGVEDDVVERLNLPLATNMFTLENGLVVAKDSGYHATPLQLGAMADADNLESKEKRRQQIANALDSVVVTLSPQEIASLAERLPLSATSSMYADNGASLQGSLDQDQYLNKRESVVAAPAGVGAGAIPSPVTRSPALSAGKEGKRDSQIWRQQLLHDSLLFSFGSKASKSAKPSHSQQPLPQHQHQHNVPDPESPRTLWHRHLRMQHKHTESDTTELKTATRVLQYAPIMDAKELARRVEEAAVTPSLPVPPPSGMTLAGSLNFRKKVVTPVVEVREEKRSEKRSEKRKSVPIMDVNTIEADVFGKGSTDEEGEGADEGERRVDATQVVVEIVDIEKVESAGNSSVSLETAFHYVYDYLGEEYFQISDKVAITHEEAPNVPPYPETRTNRNLTRNRSTERRLKAPQVPTVRSQGKHHGRPSPVIQTDLPHLKYTPPPPPPSHLPVVSASVFAPSASTCSQESQKSLNVPPLRGDRRRRSSPVGLFDHFDLPARTPPLGHYPSSPSTASAFSEDDEGEPIEL